MDPLSVATEFRFDVGEALLNTKELQGAVEGLDKTVSSAVSNLSMLAGNLITRLGYGAGLIGVLTRAYQISEDFTSDTLNFGQNITANMDHLTGTIDTFNDRLETSRMLLNNIGDVAKKNGLSSHEITAVVQRIATPLANNGKLGTNYAGGIDMAKNLLLASHAVGINPQVATESLARSLTDRMALHGQLFTRLIGTPAFRENHVRTQGQLINMETGKKIDMLSKALQQLGGSADFIAYRMNLMSTQFTLLKENLQTILKPIGDALIIPLKKIFIALNKWLSLHGAEIGQAVGKTIGDIFGDPEKLYVNVRQMMQFKGDLKRAMDWTSIGLLAGSVLSFFNKTKGVGQMLEGLFGVKGGGGFIEILMSDIGWMAKGFRILTSAVADFLPNVAALLFFFQILSRAKAKAEIADAKAWAEMMPKFLTQFVKLKTGLSNLLLPITMAIEQLSDWAAWIFKTSIMGEFLLWVLTKMADLFEVLGNIMIRALGLISAEMAVIMGWIYDRHSGMSLIESLKNVGSNAMLGYNTFLHDHPLPGGATPSPNSVVTNNNHIEARFDMREQLEPDRVAFSVTEHLKKLAINATQGSGSLHSGLMQPRTQGGH